MNTEEKKNNKKNHRHMFWSSSHTGDFSKMSEFENNHPPGWVHHTTAGGLNPSNPMHRKSLHSSEQDGEVSLLCKADTVCPKKLHSYVDLSENKICSKDNSGNWSLQWRSFQELLILCCFSFWHFKLRHHETVVKSTPSNPTKELRSPTLSSLKPDVFCSEFLQKK